ncbi:MAG: hypothetical protein A2002_05465 [Pseudomonadales bacterium GWC1_66_9]|nr:hypothetical protein [Azotobacter chroococcum]OHC11528.1 MAG: hypothetical protein A2002_05465 [Pseudomonadales bacterium GWC1_66_9]
MRYPLRGYGYGQAVFPPYPPLPLSSEFTRAFVATACLSAFQGEPRATSPAQLRRVLRQALQGGTAFAAGSRAATAVRQGDYSSALVATVVGAGGVLLIEQLLRDTTRLDKEKRHGQEE